MASLLRPLVRLIHNLAEADLSPTWPYNSGRRADAVNRADDCNYPPGQAGSVEVRHREIWHARNTRDAAMLPPPCSAVSCAGLPAGSLDDRPAALRKSLMRPN